jgi:signal transduction histidine kinase
MMGAILLMSVFLAPVGTNTAGNAGGNTGDDAASVPHVSIAAVHSLLQRHTALVTVRATLIRNGNPVYVEDSTEGAAVEDVSSQDLKIGDQLIVTGWPEETARGLVFRKASIRVLWPGLPVPPLAVTVDQAALGKFANSLIEVQGRLVSEGKSDPGEWLKIQSGSQVFLAHFDLAKGSLLLPRLDRGSLLRLRGVCSIRPEDTDYAGGFALLLRSAEDIDTISGAPWWSPRHLLELGLVLLGIVWAAHVGRVRMMRARFTAIMAERARVGHEMHDTLAQSFAGVAFQIQAAKNNSPPGDDVLDRHLDLALDMVRHSHSEAHRSIVMLRPQSLDETTNLQEAIRHSIERMTESCAIYVDFSVSGALIGLPLSVEDALYRIAQESIANALRHGHPDNLRIALDYGVRAVTLTVTDDGLGFDPSATDRSGFGLPGMRQRIRALHGTFAITSKRGEGTQVKAEVPRRSVTVAKFKSILSSYRDHYGKTTEDAWSDRMR